ncbi:MAG: hypothetical protein U0637_03790 [Phycisphaerales bacterium]
MANALSRVLHGAAHLAVWAGLYTTAATVCFTQTAGLSPIPPARVLTFAFCTASGVYLLDRIKLRDAWLDPADQMAHPDRYHFLTSRSRSVRTLMFLLLLTASLLGWNLWPQVPWLGVLAPTAACAGVLLYAARPRGRRPRPKDILLFKNLYVGAGITGFSTLVATAGHGLSNLRANPAWAAVAAVHLLIRVPADAVLCDLDDREADLAHGTHTLPARLGRTRAWNWALATRLILAAGLAAMACAPGAPRRALLSWATVTACSSIALRAAAPADLRDWVDARFTLEALAATLLILRPG